SYSVSLFLMIRRPPRSTLFPTRRSSDLAATPDRPPNRLDLAGQPQLVARPDDPLEADVVDAREQRELAAILLLGEHRDRAGLCKRLDHDHAGHDRPAREVPGEKPLVPTDRLPRD